MSTDSVKKDEIEPMSLQELHEAFRREFHFWSSQGKIGITTSLLSPKGAKGTLNLWDLENGETIGEVHYEIKRR